MGLWAPSRIRTRLPELCCFFFLRVLGSCLWPLSWEAEPGVFEYRLADPSSLRAGDFECEAFRRIPPPLGPWVEAPFLLEIPEADPPWRMLAEAVPDLLALCY